MREIKFRVINTKTKEWLHKPGEEVNLFGEQILMGGFMSSVSIPDLDDYLPLQFTGLKDKNGKEIYEGDVVRANSWANSIIVFGKIGYDGEWNGLTGYALEIWGADNNFYELQYHFDPNKLEVIGNIYENPELKP